MATWGCHMGCGTAATVWQMQLIYRPKRLRAAEGVEGGQPFRSGGLLACSPGRAVLRDVCITQPAGQLQQHSGGEDGRRRRTAAAAADIRKGDQYSHAGAGAPSFIPLA